MNATKYEATYSIAQSALSATEEVEKIVAQLRAADRPMTCKELGELIYGEEYKRIPEKNRGELTYNEFLKLQRLNDIARKHTARLNQALQHMVEAGYVIVGEIKGEPYNYETEEVVWVDEQNEPEHIDVWDAKGNRYTIINPEYNYFDRHTEIRKVMRTGCKRIRTYKWVED